MIGTLLVEGAKLLFGGVSDHFKNKREIKQAEHKAKISRLEKAQEADIEWDKIMAEGSKDSLKDEWWTGLLSIPLIMMFIPGLQQYAVDGFNNLQAAPDWYLYAVGIAIGAAFGFRKAAGMLKK